ncbi:MAG: CpaE family protein [Microthrixaceae bacterium]
MPVVVEKDPGVVQSLAAAIPPGSHVVDGHQRLDAWLARHPEEYVVVLGPSVDLESAVSITSSLRYTRPTTSIVLVRNDAELDTVVLKQAIGAGARDVVPVSDGAAVKAAVDAAYHLWVALRGPGGATRLGRLVTVFSPKGGVGKTTTAVNLALALADGGARQVCLVDLDLAFGDVAITLQLFPSHTIEEAIGSEDSVDQALLESLLTRHEDYLMVLAAPSLPDARDRITPRLVTRLLQTLREQFEYVVVDTAPSFDEITLTALDETDECVLLSTLDVPTLKNVKVAVETMDLLRIAMEHRHLLLNRADDAVGIGHDKVEAILGMPIACDVGTSIDIAAATNAGRPIVLDNPSHPASMAFKKLAASLVHDPVAPSGAPAPAAPPPEREERRRFFGKRRGTR